METRIEVQSCVPRVMNHASSSPRSELKRAAAVRPVREINNVICSLGSRPIRSGPKGLYYDCGRRTSGESRAFVTHNCRMRIVRASLLFAFSSALLSFVPSSFPSPCAFYSRVHAYSDSQNCQRQRKLSQPLMVFERDRSDAKDKRIHVGQITILPLSRQTVYFCPPR